MTRILVVDDETIIREIVADVLASDGHVVETAATGSEAVKLIHRSRPDAVVLDMMMPGLGAWDFLTRYDADTGCRGLPIAVLSTMVTGLGEFENVGVSAVIPNPFDLQSLLKTVQGLVQVQQGDADGGGAGHRQPPVVADTLRRVPLQPDDRVHL